MSSNQHYFHFTLGPVQGFVAQARRTRDFWAGSFILSWLSAVAMQAVKKQGGDVLFPAADKNYLAWLEGKGSTKKPKQGSVPNRFKAAVTEGEFSPEQVVESVNIAWRELAKLVYANDVKAIENPNTFAIWERQIQGFWEISWAMSDDIEDSSVLDRRKNWRNHIAPVEPGVKCMMMDGLQELSGIETPNSTGMNQFWSKLRTQKRTAIQSDLRENEQLCAMAFIKRRFVHYFHQLETPMPYGWVLKGWKLDTGVPSVAYMAAVHWLERALEEADADLLQDFHDKAYRLTRSYGEWSTQIECIKNAWGNSEWKALDGNIFFKSILENKKIYADQQAADKVVKALSKIDKSAGLDPVSPFYAVLLMDGDSLGMQMSNPENQTIITQGLEKFTHKVGEIAQQENGFLIYAGGDDVLAILPLEDAFNCAVKLRKHYAACFANTGVETTLSGAIEFAHIKTPLTKILSDSHGLLDDIAKDKTGRDAIACRVWKPGGLQLEWAQPWEVALQGEQVVLNKLAEEFRQYQENDAQFSSKFFYKIRERFTLLNPDKKCSTEQILDDQQAEALMVMEYLNSWGSDKHKDLGKAKAAISRLLEQCRHVTRNKETDQQSWKTSQRLDADGALLVRFLASKGVER